MNTSEKPSRPVALVTGSGAPRLGNAIVRALAERGYRVVVHAHTSAKQAKATADAINSKGGEALALLADLRDERAIAGMVRQAQEHFGSLDALVNCAAIWNRKKLQDVTAADVREHFEINTLATFLCCQQAGLIMADHSSGGSIVNFGDWATARPYVDYAAYFAAKGSIETLTRTLAVELASRNTRVRVNAVMPGPVMMPDDLPAAERAAAIAGTLLKREGSAQNVVEAVLFLLENDYVTGVCLPVDGGRTIAS